ncbi:hypothetical protein AAMO2058_000925000 [Amorphochlora amoebiformis]
MGRDESYRNKKKRPSRSSSESNRNSPNQDAKSDPNSTSVPHSRRLSRNSQVKSRGAGLGRVSGPLRMPRIPSHVPMAYSGIYKLLQKSLREDQIGGGARAGGQAEDTPKKEFGGDDRKGCSGNEEAIGIVLSCLAKREIAQGQESLMTLSLASSSHSSSSPNSITEYPPQPPSEPQVQAQHEPDQTY